MTHPDLPHLPDGLFADDDLPPDVEAAGAPLDPALLAAARAYHRPPPAPADAMWAAVQARRAPRAAPPGDAAPVRHALGPAVRHGGGGDDLAARRLARRWAPRAAAAVLLVGLGVGIGRTTAPGDDAPGAAARPAAPVETAARPTAPALAVAPPAPVTRAPSPPAAAAGRAAPRAAAAPAPQLALGPARGAASGPDAPSAPLRAATEQHLARAEALLTVFAAGSAGGAAAAPDSVWARDLLTTTRLLLDSPAGADPTRRGLLDALELVLVQIARLPRADSPAERALIDRAIRRGDLMARLRGAVPAGAPAVPAPLGS